MSGYLGSAGGGLKALQEKIRTSEDVASLIQSHFQPNPSPSQGIWLASQDEVHAMMDISDGLDCDLKRLIKSSQKGAVIETTQLPISTVLIRVSSENGWDLLELALAGGEDYCLLLTVDSKAIDTLQHNFQEKFNTPLFTIGHITDAPIEVKYCRNKEIFKADYKNFNHFQ